MHLKVQNGVDVKLATPPTKRRVPLETKLEIDADGVCQLVPLVCCAKIASDPVQNRPGSSVALVALMTSHQRHLELSNVDFSKTRPVYFKIRCGTC